MSHYKGSATFTQEGIEPVAAYCFYDGSTDQSDQKGWSGWFSDEEPAGVLMEGPAGIELFDGRTGTVVIDQLETEAPFGGHFKGDGAEP